MLYIVTATIREVERGMYDDREKSYPVTHPVDATSVSEACKMLRQYYDAKAHYNDPYGKRYYVEDDDAFEFICQATIQAQKPEY